MIDGNVKLIMQRDNSPATATFTVERYGEIIGELKVERRVMVYAINAPCMYEYLFNTYATEIAQMVTTRQHRVFFQPPRDDGAIIVSI